jgi:hypothetical protein
MRRHPFDGEGTTYLHEVLQVCIGNLMGFPQNGLACTMWISAGLSSKVAFPKLTWGPVATLAADGAKKSEIVFWAITSLSGGVKPPSSNGFKSKINFWGGTRWRLELLGSFSGFSTNLLSNWNPFMQCLASRKRETKATVSVTPQVFSSIIALHYMSISMHHFMLFHMVATNVICF